jgi:hypothetical protein
MGNALSDELIRVQAKFCNLSKLTPLIDATDSPELHNLLHMPAFGEIDGSWGVVQTDRLQSSTNYH